jgi:hypothetical protein
VEYAEGMVKTYIALTDENPDQNVTLYTYNPISHVGPYTVVLKNVGANLAKFGVAGAVHFPLEPGEERVLSDLTSLEDSLIIHSAAFYATTTVVALVYGTGKVE